MKTPRLRLDRIRERSLPAFRKQHPVIESTTSISEEVRLKTEAALKKRTTALPENPVSYLALFNEGLVDFVKESNGKCTPVDWPKQATHKLVATSWNDSPTRAMPNPRYALSVCCIPLRPHIRISALHIRLPLPRQTVSYKTTLGIQGKRAVLSDLCCIVKAQFTRSTFLKMTSAECDLFYQQLTRASRLLTLRKALK